MQEGIPDILINFITCIDPSLLPAPVPPNPEGGIYSFSYLSFPLIKRVYIRILFSYELFPLTTSHQGMDEETLREKRAETAVLLFEKPSGSFLSFLEKRGDELST